MVKLGYPRLWDNLIKVYYKSSTCHVVLSVVKHVWCEQAYNSKGNIVREGEKERERERERFSLRLSTQRVASSKERAGFS